MTAQKNSIRLIHLQDGGTFTPEILISPILTPAPINVAITAISVSGGALSISTDYPIPDDTFFFIIKLSAPLLPSQISQYNKKKIFAYTNTAGYTQTITSLYMQKFGILPTVGAYINSEISLYDKTINTFGSFSKQRTIVTS